jgi:hypothetical protein
MAVIWRFIRRSLASETVILNKSTHPPVGIASPAKRIFDYGMRAGISQGDDRPDKLHFETYSCKINRYYVA